jgi:hypothetical protein
MIVGFRPVVGKMNVPDMPPEFFVEHIVAVAAEIGLSEIQVEL